MLKWNAAKTYSVAFQVSINRARRKCESIAPSIKRLRLLMSSIASLNFVEHEYYTHTTSSHYTKNSLSTGKDIDQCLLFLQAECDCNLCPHFWKLFLKTRTFGEMWNGFRNLLIGLYYDVRERKRIQVQDMLCKRLVKQSRYFLASFIVPCCWSLVCSQRWHKISNIGSEFSRHFIQVSNEISA